jgi:hypothetical protein
MDTGLFKFNVNKFIEKHTLTFSKMTFKAATTSAESDLEHSTLE